MDTHLASISWKDVTPGSADWIGTELDSTFRPFLPLGSVFDVRSNGLKSNRDPWVYNASADGLAANISKTIEFYNDHVSRWTNTHQRGTVDSFVRNDDSRISWSRDLKADLQRGRFVEFAASKIRQAAYRPFYRTFVYFDRIFNEEVYALPTIFPTRESEKENRSVVATIDKQIPFSALMVSCIPCVHLGGRPSQCFPFYTYEEDGSNRRENITDRALEQFRVHYQDPSISKWDIFHYVYAVLHHPTYRERYAANLRRELPRVPFVKAGASGRNGGGPQDDKGVFWALVKAGERLADLHVNYEKQPEYPLKRTENGKLDWRVQKMRLGKDKTSLVYNSFLKLSGIPPETYEYRLGNRSALEWVVDQYQVSTDKRSGIVNDPNRADDMEYIVRLIGQVVTVSMETVKIVKALPELVIGEARAAGSSN